MSEVTLVGMEGALLPHFCAFLKAGLKSTVEEVLRTGTDSSRWNLDV